MPFRSLPDAKRCYFEKGEYLFHAQEKIEYLYYLIEGTVHREITTVGGHETIVNVKTTENAIGALVGLLVLFRPGKISTSNFVAKSKCVCYRIPAKHCMEYFYRRPDILVQIIEMVLEESAKITQLYHMKQEGTLSSQICAFLLEHCSQANNCMVPNNWTNLELAKFFGVHQVTVARLLKALKQEKLIEKNKKSIIILDRPRLEQIAQGVEQISYRYQSK